MRLVTATCILAGVAITTRVAPLRLVVGVEPNLVIEGERTTDDLTAAAASRRMILHSLDPLEIRSQKRDVKLVFELQDLVPFATPHRAATIVTEIIDPVPQISREHFGFTEHVVVQEARLRAAPRDQLLVAGSRDCRF